MLAKTPIGSISIHAPREGSDFHAVDTDGFIHIFQSTLPARGATVPLDNAGNDMEFQSTLPARGATYWYGRILLFILFQSTLPARGATIKSITTRI